MLWILLLRCTTVLCIQSVAEQVAERDRHVLNMLQNPMEDGGKLMTEAVKSYIMLIKLLTDKIILQEISYLECKNIYDQGTAQFIFYEIDANKRNDIKIKFKWSDTEVSRLKSLIDNATDVWIKYLDAYFREFGGEVEEPTIRSMFTA